MRRTVGYNDHTTQALRPYRVYSKVETDPFLGALFSEEVPAC
jgi:hypothetical protein